MFLPACGSATPLLTGPNNALLCWSEPVHYL